MTIRSIDLQVMIPKTTEVARNQQITEQASALQQQLQAAEWQETAAHRQAQVQTSPKGEGGKVNRQNDQQKHAKQEQEKEEATDHHNTNNNSNPEPTGSVGHHIDIKT